MVPISYTLKRIYEEGIVPKGLPERIDFSSRFRSSSNPSDQLPPSFVKAGKLTRDGITKNSNQAPTRFPSQHQQTSGFRRPYKPASTTPCRACGYSNRDLHKILDRIHPADGNPTQCCFRGPDFNPDKDMRTILHQYNLKHQNDKRQNDSKQDRSSILPKLPTLVRPKTNLIMDTLDKTHITTDLQQDYYFDDEYSLPSNQSNDQLGNQDEQLPNDNDIENLSSNTPVISNLQNDPSALPTPQANKAFQIFDSSFNNDALPSPHCSSAKFTTNDLSCRKSGESSSSRATSFDGDNERPIGLCIN